MTSRANRKQMQRMAGVRSMKGLGQMQGLAMAQCVKMIEGDDKARANECLQEIQAICGRYDCDMVPEITISPAEMRAAVRVKAKPRQGIVPE